MGGGVLDPCHFMLIKTLIVLYTALIFPEKLVAMFSSGAISLKLLTTRNGLCFTIRRYRAC